MRQLFLLAVASSLLGGCGGDKTAAEAEPQPEGGGGMVTTPGAGPIAPVDPYSSLGGYGSSPSGQVAKDRAKSAATKAGQGSIGGYSEPE